MLKDHSNTSAVRQVILDVIQQEYTQEGFLMPDFLLPEPVEREFLVFRAPVMKLWIVMQKEDDPDRRAIVFSTERRCFGIATRSIATIPGKGFFIRYCDSFRHALEKCGIDIPHYPL